MSIFRASMAAVLMTASACTFATSAAIVPAAAAGAAVAVSAGRQASAVGPTACNRCHMAVHPLYERMDRAVMHPEWRLDGWDVSRLETPEGEVYTYTRDSGKVQRLFLFKPYGDARFHFMLPARGDNPHRLP